MARAGRPTKYTDELLEKANQYIDGGWVLLGHAVPSDYGLAMHLGISRQTLYVWSSEEGKEHFSDILGKLETLQAGNLINRGLNNEINSTITKLMLTKHGYSDKQEITGKDGKDLIPAAREILDEIEGTSAGLPRTAGETV